MNWTIDWLRTTPVTATPPECVITAGWRCTDTQDGFTGAVYATCSFTEPGDPFIPYADLTQDDVLGWCWANGVDKDATEAAVVAQIEAQKNPTEIQPPLPWSNQ